MRAAGVQDVAPPRLSMTPGSGGRAKSVRGEAEGGAQRWVEGRS